MGIATQPELTPKPVLEPSSFDVLRDLYSSKLVNQESNPYGFDPSKGQSQASLYTGNGRGTFDPMSGNYGPNPGSYPNPGSMAGPSMGGQGGGGMYGFGGGHGSTMPAPMGSGDWQSGAGMGADKMGGGQDASRGALMAYIMELMKGSGQQQMQAPMMPGRQMGMDGQCMLGHDGAAPSPPQVDPANFGGSAGTVQSWLNMNPGNHGAFGTQGSGGWTNVYDMENAWGGGRGGSTPPPGGGGGTPPPNSSPQTAPRSAPQIPFNNPLIPQGYPTPFDRNPTTVSRPPNGPPQQQPPTGGGGGMGGYNPKRPIGMDSPYMFQRGPMAPLGMDAFPGQPGVGGNGFVGFAGGGSAPLGSPGAGGAPQGIQALIQALMAGGGGGGGGMGGGMGGMMRRRRPIGMDAQQPPMMNFRGHSDPRRAGQQPGHRRPGSQPMPMNPYARQGR